MNAKGSLSGSKNTTSGRLREMQTSLKVGPYEFSKGLINRRSSDGFSIELPSHRSWIQFQNSIRKIVISKSKPNQRTQNNNIGSYTHLITN